MQPHELFIFEHFDPGGAIVVGPDRIIDAGKIDIDTTSAWFYEVRQQKAYCVYNEPATTLLSQDDIYGKGPDVEGRRAARRADYCER
jgi:hypothetical protein